MRYVICGLWLGLALCATFGCGGSSEESGAVADSGGQAPAASPGGAMGGVDMPGADAGVAGAPAGGPLPDGGDGSGDATMPGDPSDSSGGAAGAPPGLMSAGSGAGGSPTDPAAGGSPGPGGYPGVGGQPGVGDGSSEGLSGGYPGAGGVPADAAGGAADGLSGGYPGAGGAAGAAGYGSSMRGAAAGEAGAISSPGAGGYPGGIPGADGTAGAEGQPAPPATYDEFAKQAFAQGRERDAIQFLQAWALTSDAGASEVLSNIQWVNGLRRPTMAVRWGVGVQVNMPRGFSGDAKPIGTQQAFTAGRAGRNEAAAGGYGAGLNDRGSGGIGSGDLGGGGLGGGSAGDSAIAQYAGDFGTAILDKFQSRVSSGKFGKVLKDAPTGASGSDASGYGAAGGLVGAGAGEAAGLSSGDAGAGIMGLGRRRGGGEGGGELGAGVEGQIAPGLTLIGVGNEKELKSKAREARVDVLAIFRVKLTVTRAGFIDNDCDLVLVDPSKEKAEFYRTVSLNNIKVQKDREQNKDDGVEKAVEKLFEYIDKDLTLTVMPSVVTPAVVKNTRVGKQLLGGPIDDPLAVLTELRFYHRNKLLADADAAAAIAKVAGGEDNAKTLLEGKEEDRKKVVEKWLPKG